MCSYWRCSFSPTPRRCFFSGIRAPFRSAALADRFDQIPLAHLRAAGNVPVLGDLVELLAVAILERMTCAAAALAASCLLHVSPRGLDLACRSHPIPLLLCCQVCTRLGRVLFALLAALVRSHELG